MTNRCRWRGKQEERREVCNDRQRRTWSEANADYSVPILTIVEMLGMRADQGVPKPEQ